MVCFIQSSDLPKTSSISSRLDQGMHAFFLHHHRVFTKQYLLSDLTNKAFQTHSMLNSLLSQTQEFSGPPNDYGMHSRQHHRMPAGMRMAPHAGQSTPKPGDLPPSGSVYPHYNVPPHGKVVWQAQPRGGTTHSTEMLTQHACLYCLWC